MLDFYLQVETQSKETRDYHTTSLSIRLILLIYFENIFTACSALAREKWQLINIIC